LGGQTDLLTVIVIGAGTDFILSMALTPLMPKLGAHPIRISVLV
jgi:hypothetical protein